MFQHIGTGTSSYPGPRCTSKVPVTCDGHGDYIGILTVNARRKVKDPLRLDPTRTTPLRKRFLAETNRRWAKLLAKIRELVIKDDAFGLKLEAVKPSNLVAQQDRQRWRFLTADEKVEAYHTWLEQAIRRNILTVDNGKDAWTAQYIGSAYRQGLVRAYTDARRYPNLDMPAGFAEGTQQEFLRAAFSAPETASKLRLLQTRTYESLRGVTATMSSRMGVTLAQGLADGLGVMELGKRLSAAADLPLARARTIARTEVMHAHAEGQLDSFEMLEVDELGVMAEWSTAGDERVCPVCQPLEGVVMTVKEARGLIPRHPNCRCTWIPANVTEKEAKQKRTKRRIDSAVTESIKKETGSGSARQARERSRWAGADKNFKSKKSQR